MVIFKKRLKEKRNELGLTQEELGKNIYLSKGEVCAYEKGKTLILTAFLYQIAKKYNISIDWLVGASSKIKRN